MLNMSFPTSTKLFVDISSVISVNSNKNENDCTSYELKLNMY